MRIFLFAIWFGLGTLLAAAAPGTPVTCQTVSAPGAPALALQVVRFDRSRTALRVIDLPPGASVAEGARQAGALAGVNGGYFQPDHTPLGLVISGGKTLHPLEQSKILTGMLAVTPRGAALLRNAEFRPGRAVREALQAGPFLVDHGRAVGGLNAVRRAERTVLLADRQGAAALLSTGPVTLDELARLLAAPGLIEGLEIDRALNLDGGSSTALWVKGEPSVSRREWKPVRNAVVVVPLGR
ncbi:MAG: phosphodiester glycosidase family protein [Chthoniobacteraceae bacterium]|nr:phosphodiester glycosidase family protein [Chthoniobacteraceae bacterium]